MLPLIRGGAVAATFALALLCIVLVALHPSNTQRTTIIMKRDIYVLPPIQTTPGVVSSIHSYDSQGSAIIYISGIIASFANIIATIFIFWRSYATKRQNDDQKFTPSQRFPVYMAILDCLTGICIMANLFYPFIYDHLPSHLICVGFGFVTALLTGINMTLVGCIAFISWLKVCRQRSFALGNADWKLWAFATALPLVVGVTTAGLDGYGEDTYWCFATDYSPGGKFEFVFTVVFNYIGLAITTFCYLSVISRLHTADNDLAFSMSIAALKGSQNFLPSPPTVASYPEHTDIGSSISAHESMFSSSSAEFLTPPPATHQRQHTYPPFSPMSIIIPPPITHSLNSRHTSSLYSKNDTGKLVPPESFGTSSTPLTPISIANPELRVPVYANTAEKRTDVSLEGATKKMSHYIFVHLIQYTPIVIYCIAILSGNQTWWVYFLTVTFLNLGGVAKAYTYMYNEGFRDKVRLARELQKSDENDFQYEKSNVVYHTGPTNTNATNSPALLSSSYRSNPLVSCQPNPTATVWSTASDDEISVISLPIPPSRRRQQATEGSQPSSPAFSGVKKPVDTFDHSSFPMPADYPNSYRSSSRPHSAFSPSGQDISIPVGVATSTTDIPNPFRNSIVSTLEAVASASTSHDSFVADSSFSAARQKKHVIRTPNSSAERNQQKMPGSSSRHQRGSRRTGGSGSLISRASGFAGSHTVQEEDENQESYDVDYYGIEDYETEDNEVGVIMHRGPQEMYDEDRGDLSDESDISSIEDIVTRYKAKKVSVVNFLKD